EDIIVSAAGSHDPDGEIVRYRFDFGDGTIINNDDIDTLSYTYEGGGIFTVEVRVTDDAGGVSTERCDINILSADAPRVRILRPQGERDTTQGEVITFEVDARGGPGRNIEGVVLLLDGEQIAEDLDAPYEMAMQVAADAASGATLQVVARATDDSGEAGDSEPTFLNVINDPPVATFIAVPFLGANDAPSVRVDAAGVSDDYTAAAELVVRFDFDDDGNWDTEWSPEKSAEHAYPGEGEYTIRMEVRDGVGQVSETTRDLRFDDERVVSGDIESEVWTGVVTVTGDVTVLAGHTLTIAPGTQILFARVDQNMDNIGDFGIDVLGGILVQGTAAAPVVFTQFGQARARNAWDRIRIRGDQESSVAHAVIEYGHIGLHVERAVPVNDVTIREMGSSGVHMAGTGASFTNV
ncbi:MAG: PKD domain-containing protein, partial [Actinomycetia bacterium]|nr:PKD domain-containing protein [Actinomycetes bacterium]